MSPSHRFSDRFIHQNFARQYGYFWLPCPVCHEPFGGHEWGPGDEDGDCSIIDTVQFYDWNRGFVAGSMSGGVCPKPECMAEARHRNRRRLASEKRRMRRQVRTAVGIWQRHVHPDTGKPLGPWFLRRNRPLASQ